MTKKYELTWLGKHLSSILNALIAGGLFILVLMFINFNIKFAEIVKGQNDILEAIKLQTIDNKLTSEEKTSIIICMLQVPINQRTTDVLSNCRKQAAEGGNGIAPVKSSPQASQAPQSSPGSQHIQSPQSTQPLEKPVNNIVTKILKKVGLE